MAPLLLKLPGCVARHALAGIKKILLVLREASFYFIIFRSALFAQRAREENRAAGFSVVLPSVHVLTHTHVRTPPRRAEPFTSLQARQRWQQERSKEATLTFSLARVCV